MKKLLLLLLALMILGGANAQKPRGAKSHAQKPKAPVPVSISTVKLLSNYEIDSTMVNDTAFVMEYLESMPQDYVELTNYCVSVRTKAQQAIHSLENDYPYRDSLIWIDSNTVVSDYVVYGARLRRLADIMGRMSIRYSRLEQQRVEMEKEAARKRAEEEARLLQEARDKQAADLIANIDFRHRGIIDSCSGNGIKDKVRLKELKDLYYSYLMVYNKYDLSVKHASDESISKLNELYSFQCDLSRDVLGPNSLPSQITNFKNILKERCDKENTDVYRSYTHVCKQPSVPASFTNVKEYGDYVLELQKIQNMQQCYLRTLDLRAAISKGSNDIIKLYEKKYRDVVNSYKDALRTLNQKPSFVTYAEGQVFILGLEGFIAAQQRYIDDYALLEDISFRSDSITNNGFFRDVSNAYRDVQPSLVPVPDFVSTAGADRYEAQLAEVVRVQKCYLEVIRMRHEINRLDDTLAANRKTDRTLFSGYKLLRKQADLTPSFSTLERGNNFISMLNSHMDMQRLCLRTIAKRATIIANSDEIEAKDDNYRNISKAYSRMLKAYDNIDEITHYEDLRRYARQCDAILEMQEAFLRILQTDRASATDASLKRETDIERIKTFVGLE